MTPGVDVSALFGRAAELAAQFRGGLPDRPVAPQADLPAAIRLLDRPLPAEPADPAAVLEELAGAAAPGVTSSAGPRFFGFVTGGALPAATAADMLAAGWDQCAFNAVLSPAAAAAEHVAGSWLKDLLGVPATASVGLTTGAQGANTVGLAAGRHRSCSRPVGTCRPAG